MNEYTFNAVQLKSGTNDVLVDNVGKEPHIVAAAQMKPGATIAEVRNFIRREKGEPPIIEKEGFGSAILDGGEAQISQLDLKPGKYALICFIPDRNGGPPHLAKGMISQATVR